VWNQINNIVSPEWLHDHLLDQNLVILEVYQANNKAGLKSDTLKSIKGSIPVDLKSDFSDPNGTFPNTFPTRNQFETTCNRLGLSNESKVIIVDRLGIYTSPRLWFIFKAMGHKNVAVLNGGLPAWKDNEYEVFNNMKDIVPKENYSAQPIPQLIKRISDIKENCTSQKSILIDARSYDRFLSLVPEPRAEIRSGNIPNSISIPFKSLLDGYKYKSSVELQLIFEAHNLSNKPLIFSCGSGVTACIVMLATELINTNPKSIYDGSWTEWASLIKE